MITGTETSTYRRMFFKLSTAGGFVAVVFFPVSVSISQLGLFLAIAGWILFRTAPVKSEVRVKNSDVWELPFVLPNALKASLGIYAVMLLSFLIHSFSDGFSTEKFLRSEFRDVFLSGMAFWVISYSSDERGRERIRMWLTIALFLILTAGFISIFSRYRLAKIPYHLMHGWEVAKSIRFQHHAGTLFAGTPVQFHLYVPIGLMNTHLTYAAHLSMLLPAVLLRPLHQFVISQTRMKFSALVAFIPAGIGALILVLNNGRSAILGLIFALVIGIYFYARNYWKKKILKIVYPFIVIIMLFGLVAVFSPNLGERFEHLMDSLAGKSKITDYQRYFLWQASLDVVSDHPLAGVGPGNFQSAVEEKILEYSIRNPSLWYSYFIIQRGHAHNDALHLQAIAGVLAVFFYFLFFLLLLYEMLRPDRPLRETWWLWGSAVILPAGIFQCYFQDDEVLMPFWILAGLVLSKNLSSEKGKGDRGESQKN